MCREQSPQAMASGCIPRHVSQHGAVDLQPGGLDDGYYRRAAVRRCCQYYDPPVVLFETNAGHRELHFSRRSNLKTAGKLSSINRHRFSAFTPDGEEITAF
jgi:hypothetical protein